MLYIFQKVKESMMRKNDKSIDSGSSTESKQKKLEENQHNKPQSNC